MALIKCPECGETISDKAESCPHCGYVLVLKKTRKQFNKMKIIKWVIPTICLLGIVALITVFFPHKKDISGTQDIKIERWKLISTGKYSDTYEGTVISPNKNPMIAVLGTDSQPINNFAFMQDGIGKLEAGTSGDPTEEYMISGYLLGKEINDKAIKTVKSEDSDYDDYDYAEETSCDLDVTIEMNKAQSGLLFGELSNDVSDEEAEFIVVPVFNGVGKTYQWVSDLPYKVRGVNAVFKPQYFCEYNKLSEKKYKIIKKYQMDREEDDDCVSYSGGETIQLNDIKDGMVFYTVKEKKGGEEELQISSVKDGNCEIEIYKYINLNKEKDTKPEYNIELQGYIELGKVKEEKKNE